MYLPVSSSTSDVKVQSSDGRVFDLHKALLEANTGAFPGPDVDSKDEIVYLTETGDVLELLFAFVYPKRHPDLEGVGFEPLAALAEAVGKYEVYSAVNTCNMRLKSFLPDKKIEIFTYALKHGYPKLAGEVYPYLVLSPLVPVLKALPAQYILPWAEYHEQWSSVIRDARKRIKNLRAASQVANCHSGSAVCNICRSSLYTWVAIIEEQPSISALKVALSSASTSGSIFLECCKGSVVNATTSTSLIEFTSPFGQIFGQQCDHIVALARSCRASFQLIPKFGQLVGKDQSA